MLIKGWTELQFSSRKTVDFIDITHELIMDVANSGIRDGFGIIFIPHTTAGLTINENADPDVLRDLIMAFDKIVPADLPYLHSEGNSPAHLKASLVGFERMIPVKDGKLALGVWQGIYLCEFDGPRTRKVLVSWHGE